MWGGGTIEIRHGVAGGASGHRSSWGYSRAIEVGA